MYVRITVSAIGILSAVLLLIIGCSDKPFTSTSVSITPDAKATTWLPLEQGERISYTYLEPELKHVDAEVTDPVTILGEPGYKIRWTDQGTGENWYTYRYVKGNAIFESSSVSDPGYRILESPFVAGHSWDRYDTTTIVIGGGTTDDDGHNGKDGDGITLKDLPGSDYGQMEIIGFEAVNALDNATYGNCLKVAWHNAPNHTCYYWYAAGVGLIKFETGYNTLDPNEDHPVVIMADHKIVEY